jgi:hypothetical protein
MYQSQNFMDEGCKYRYNIFTKITALIKIHFTVFH